MKKVMDAEGNIELTVEDIVGKDNMEKISKTIVDLSTQTVDKQGDKK